MLLITKRLGVNGFEEPVSIENTIEIRKRGQLIAHKERNGWVVDVPSELTTVLSILEYHMLKSILANSKLCADHARMSSNYYELVQKIEELATDAGLITE